MQITARPQGRVGRSNTNSGILFPLMIGQYLHMQYHNRGYLRGYSSHPILKKRGLHAKKVVVIFIALWTLYG